ncbi:MAG: hypothetical protein IJA75_00780 [Oscillospiraceae bacterium]|nr:hypothetical protein [Oscillospiraceae bacterium]
MKKLSLALVLCLVIGMFAGCAGTPVIYYTDCTCPAGSHDVAAPAITEPAPAETEAPVLEEGALKTGMFIMTGISDSKSATAEAEGEAKYDVTVVAVLVDDEGIIHDCIIDGIAASVKFDASGVITTDLAAAPQTKNELGENYGMVAWGGAVAEWDAQAAALADFVVGKNVGQLQGVAVSESGYAPEGSDLATSATIYLGGYVKAIELAAASAQHLGAQSGDELKMAIITGIDSSVSATEEKEGTAQLDVDVAAVTVNGETITSCYIDSVQAKVNFDLTGTVTTDVNTTPSTKNQLGEQYGMVAWGGAIAEWNVQAASFASYVTGKTAAEVAGIAVDDSIHPADADLATSVTIAIGGFQALIAKALG